jgi:HPt (histidine-containing phosphotransfer) domain-containing protein
MTDIIFFLYHPVEADTAGEPTSTAEGGHMAEQPILDLRQAVSDLGDDEDIYREVLDTYLEDTPQLIAAIRTAIDGADVEVLYRNAHSLKSTSFTVGGRRLGQAAFTLEQDARQGKMEGAAEKLAEIESEYALLLDDLKKAGKLS